MNSSQLDQNYLHPVNSGATRPYQLITLTGDNKKALEKLRNNFTFILDENYNINIADAAYTLVFNSKPSSCKSYLIVKDNQDLREEIKSINYYKTKDSRSQIIFLFSGEIDYYVNMGSELYDNEKIFKDAADSCFKFLSDNYNLDLKQVLYPELNNVIKAQKLIIKPLYALLSLFVLEYSLAKLWMHWGIKPSAVMGYSIGKYIAACISGLLSLEHTLKVVFNIGEIYNRLNGEMINVFLPEEKINNYLSEDISLAAVNTHNSCILSGSNDAIDGLREALRIKGINYNKIQLNSAAHSHLLDPYLDEFKSIINSVEFKRIDIPIISCMTGTLINEDEIKKPGYWLNHLRSTIRFSKGSQELLKNKNNVYLEVGPSKTLTSLMKFNGNFKDDKKFIHSLKYPTEKFNDYKTILNALGKLWINNIDIKWENFWEYQDRANLNKLFKN